MPYTFLEFGQRQKLRSAVRAELDRIAVKYGAVLVPCRDTGRAWRYWFEADTEPYTEKMCEAVRRDILLSGIEIPGWDITDRDRHEARYPVSEETRAVRDEINRVNCDAYERDRLAGRLDDDSSADE